VPKPPNSTTHPFTLLVKPTGAACNLACEYCFYLGKERLYPGSRLRMSDEVLKSYILQLLASQPQGAVNLSWQGGEPTLMGLEFFRRSVELVKQYIKPGQEATYSLQTNGILLDQEWCAFFQEHHFLVGLSIDGPASMHNTFRVDQGGRGTYDRVVYAWKLLQKYRVDTNILCAVHAVNASHPLEVYRFLRDDLQARFIQFIPIVERVASVPARQATEDRPEQNTVSRRSVRPQQYGSFLVDVFQEWVHQDVSTVFVQIFDSALASWCHFPASVCVYQETCGSSLVLEHNGDLYSCDHFVEPAYRLGNILETPLADLAGSGRQRRFGLDKRGRLPAYCRTCNVRFACQGECPRNRFMPIPGGRNPCEGEDGLNYLCAGYRQFYHHIDRPMRIMADLLRRGRAPAEIMRM
jgi:uncharacterized protein